MSEPVSMAEMVTLNIDGVDVSVPKGTLLIRAAEAAGVAIPRFCDHPLLDPAAACRECMVEITDAGNGRGFPKPQPSCATTVAAGMTVKTQKTSSSAADAQAEILELLLINHPLDCPICDKAGECPLQNQALADGRSESRFDGAKRQFPKPVPMSDLILLDRERCVLCTRCTRFAEQIAGDPLLQLVERGAKQQIGIYPEEPFDSYFSGNVVQICPVGALTSSDYRFSARPFDLTSTVTTCENCAAGCQIRVDARHGEVRRRLAGEEGEVNEEWSCDKGRFGFFSARGNDRVTRPLVRRGGELVPTSWPEALAAAARGLKLAEGSVGVLTGGRLTTETAYAYSRFARGVLGTDSIDCRARASSDEETQFLASRVAGRSFEDSVHYADFDAATKVVLVAFEPEDESPNVFLRLRKAVRKNGLVVETVAPYLSRGSAKLGATLVPTRPCDVVAAVSGLSLDGSTVVLVGERLAQIPGGLSAVVAAVDASGAKMAWVPRRVGEIGAIEAGCLPGLLPGGRPLTDEAARLEVSALWKSELVARVGLDAAAQLQAAADGSLKALVTAGVEAGDFPDPQAALAGFDQAFVVALESRLSDVTDHADVVLPVDLLEQTEGSFLDWEHRVRPVKQVVANPRTPMTEIRVLAALSEALGADLGFRTSQGAADALAALPAWQGTTVTLTAVDPAPAPPTGVVLSSWRELIDDSRSLDGADSLLDTARPVVARISPQTLRVEGLATSSYVRLTGPKGSVTLPLHVEPTMADGVIWAPARARDNTLTQLGVCVGRAVTLAAAPGPKKEGEE
ncbi:MAG: NADH-quinone oxidoreductase subunit G [Propionibacteriaceae bacterium]|jgi:NADH-quinone oxidoreductase subunit G|nr:NADH-quinone oxidoreductase subunit G [Propionibacteriaceae bacterium]